MDFSGIYELRERLRVSMIAGSLLFEEDFRCKKAIDRVRPLAGAAPVFAKLTEQCDKLLSSSSKDRALILADTITLTDAIICTLESAAVKADAQDLQAEEIKSNILDIPYSKLRELKTALTEKGSGHYAVIRQYAEQEPNIFSDFRVLPSLVKALGASFADTAEMVCSIMIEKMDNCMVPLLKKDFNPKGGKEMERRLRVIMAKEGAGANDFYLQILPDAKADLRIRVIEALRYSEKNRELLESLRSDKNVSVRQAAQDSLEYLNKSFASAGSRLFSGLVNSVSKIVK